MFCAYVCVWVCVCRPQHTNDRLIKQLIKAREIGSEISLLLFGKNGSTHHKKEGARRTGRAEKRKKVGDSLRAVGQECVKVCPMAPPSPFLAPLLSISLAALGVSVCACVRVRHCGGFVPV